MGGKGSGRLKKPTTIRIAEGNRSRTPIPDEVRPSDKAKKPKRFKSPLEKRAWEKLTPPLFDMGLATNADQEMLERMCYWWAEHFRYAYGDQADFGKSERAFRQFERISAKFGMTPSDRAGLSVNDKPKKNEVERFLA